MRIKPILPIAFLALGMATAQAQAPQTRYDLLARKPGGASDFVPNVQSNPARTIATPTIGIGASGSGSAQDSMCRQYPGFTVTGTSFGYCDFRSTTESTAGCECGSYGYYQHYTSSLSGSGSYQEITWQNCTPCPPPIVPGGGTSFPPDCRSEGSSFGCDGGDPGPSGN